MSGENRNHGHGGDAVLKKILRSKRGEGYLDAVSYTHLDVYKRQYPPYGEAQARELIDCLREIAPYVVIDCGSYIANDILSAVALMEADSVLRLANADLKSISYLSSQLPLLKDAKWDTDKQYKIAANVKPQQAGEQIGQALGNVAFILPHSEELEAQFLAGILLSDLTMKESRSFRLSLIHISRTSVRMDSPKQITSV